MFVVAVCPITSAHVSDRVPTGRLRVPPPLRLCVRTRVSVTVRHVGLSGTTPVPRVSSPLGPGLQSPTPHGGRTSVKEGTEGDFCVVPACHDLHACGHDLVDGHDLRRKSLDPRGGSAPPHDDPGQTKYPILAETD